MASDMSNFMVCANELVVFPSSSAGISPSKAPSSAHMRLRSSVVETTVA